MDYEVTMKDVAPEHTASIRGTFRITELPEVMAREFGRIMAALDSEGMRSSGSALAIYHGWNEETVDVEMAVTIEGVFFPQDRRRGARASRSPGGKVIFTEHVGPYDQIAAAYGAMQAYAKANGLKLATTMWERYLTDPAVEPDLNKHVTEVYWPLA